MARRIFYFLEPSKVRTYHVTLIEGYLAAILASPSIKATHDVVFCACDSLFRNISEQIRSRIPHRSIPVIDQDKHHVVRKSLLEFWVMLTFMLRMRRYDILFVSCLMPTALLLIEFVNRLLRRRNIFVVIHGEIEAAFSGRIPGWRSIGYWAIRWLKARRKDSFIRIVVIDDFIKTALTARFPDRFDPDSVLVAHHPITAFVSPEAVQSDEFIICFIGHRSPAKGFDEFRRMAAAHLSLQFVAIGGGKVEDVRSGEVWPISGNEGFHRAIAASALAIFPYLDAYDCSLSAAVLDALSTGVHIVATNRASFISLSQAFGPNVVTICSAPGEFDDLLADRVRIVALKGGQAKRLQDLENSKYGVGQVAADFEQICAASCRPALD